MMTTPAPRPGTLYAARLPAALRDQRGREYTVRELRPDDRPALEAFYAAFEPKRAAQGLPPEGEARVARWLSSILPFGWHLIVEMADALVGHAMLIPMQREHVCEYAIFLDEKVRGCGVGTQVNRLSVEMARALGLERLWLSVEPHNRPALRSYEKAGFRYRPGTVFSSEVEMELEL